MTNLKGEEERLIDDVLVMRDDEWNMSFDLDASEVKLQALLTRVREDESKRWMDMVGEKIDKSTVELMTNSFNEGVEYTKERYETMLNEMLSGKVD